MHGKSTTVLEMEHNIIDFITLCENPYVAGTNKKSLYSSIRVFSPIKLFLFFIVPRHSRTLRYSNIIAKRLSVDRRTNERFSVFRESVSDGYTRVARHLLLVFRRLPFRYHSSVLLGRPSHAKTVGFQRQRMADFGRRVVADVVQL
jgi:hypothetical protein